MCGKSMNMMKVCGKMPSEARLEKLAYISWWKDNLLFPVLPVPCPPCLCRDFGTQVQESFNVQKVYENSWKFIHRVEFKYHPCWVYWQSNGIFLDGRVRCPTEDPNPFKIGTWYLCESASKSCTDWWRNKLSCPKVFSFVISTYEKCSP